MDRDTLLLIAFALLAVAGTVLGVGGVAFYRRDRSAAREEGPAGDTPADGEPSDEAEGYVGSDPASAQQGGAEDGP
jgi:hypothetical protein